MLKKLIILLLFTVSLVSSAADKRFTLVIDAGHGGRDAGAVGAISKEKSINLSVALAFGRYVEQNCPSVKVVYTRKKDVFVELQERADIANRNKADLFISIHTNAVAKGKTVKGFETYTLGMHRAGDNLEVAKRENSVITLESNYRSRYQGFDPNSAESYIIFEYMQDQNMANSVNLAKYIQSSVCSAASRINKGVHQAGFLVLRETSMPSCLVELGFISNPEEERQLNDPTTQDQMARGLYKAFAQYLDKYGNGVKALSPVAEPKPAPAAEPKKSPKEEVRNSPEEKDVAFIPEPKTASEPEPKTEKKEEKKAEQKAEPKDAPDAKADAKDDATQESDDAPVFKIQILVGSNKLSSGSPQFKKLEPVDCYEEDGKYKYTYGSSTDYNEVYSLRKTILDKFPEAFVIAFKGGQKVNVNDAIKEWKKTKR